MDLLLLPIVLLILCLLFYGWRIYLIQHTLNFIKSIPELYQLWKERRIHLEQKLDRTKFASREWLLIEKELFISFSSQKARIASEELLTSYIRSQSDQLSKNIILLNKQVTDKTFEVQKRELAYKRRLHWIGWSKKWVGLQEIRFFY